jgi:AcrR family transcriptional regulator
VARTPGGYASGHLTRLRLIVAAEALFADRGIAAVSLNEVRLAAGQSNAAAVNYHFGSKEQLLRAIIEHRIERIEADRAELLRALDGTDDPRQILAALILPQAGSIERGEHYVGLVAQLATGALGWFDEYAYLLADPDVTPGGHRVHTLLRARLEDLPSAVADRRLMFLYTSAFRALAQHLRQKKSGTAPPTPLYVSELLDTLVAVLDAPVSAETLARHADQ